MAAGSDCRCCSTFQGCVSRLGLPPEAGEGKAVAPLAHWAELHRSLTAAGHEAVLSPGISPREQELLGELKKLLLGVPALPPLPDLLTFVAVLKRAPLFISGDTGPLHFSAGLGVPAIGLFGPSPAGKWAPLGNQHHALQADKCTCGGNTSVFLGATPSMAAISP